MTMARRILLFLTLALAMTLVASACGSNSSSGESTAAPTGGGAASTNPKDITGTLRLLSYTDGFDTGYI